MLQYFNILSLLTFAADCDDYRWYSVGINDITSTISSLASYRYNEDSNNDGFLSINGAATKGGCGYPGQLVTYIKSGIVEEAVGNEIFEWDKIRYTQKFWGTASCWTVFGGTNTVRLPYEYGLIPYNSTIDTLINYNIIEGSWNGQTNRCDNELSNHWHAYNGNGYKGSLRLELRRDLNQTQVGIGTGTGCNGSPSWEYSFIEVGYKNITTTAAATTTTPTTSTTASITISTSSSSEMVKVDGSYRCDSLTENIDIIYDIDYNECLEECLYSYNNQCVMINYIKKVNSLSDLRCYIFGQQCRIIQDNGDNNLIAIKRNVLNDICTDYPSDWSDIYDDKCSYYNKYNWCNNETIDNNLTISDFIVHSDEYYGLNAIQTCCECGGGLQLFNNIKMEFSISFNGTSVFTDNLLCEWNLGNPQQYTNYNGYWDNMDLYDLCTKMKNKIYNNFQFMLHSNQMTLNQTEIDCNLFIDDSFSNSINSNIILCDFDLYQESSDQLYFISIFDINIINKTSIIYLNSEWVNITDSFLSYTTVQYDQCVQSLSVSNSNLYGIFPCNITNFTELTTTSTTTSTSTRTTENTSASSVSSVSTITSAPSVSTITSAPSVAATKTAITLIIMSSIFLVCFVIIIIGFRFYINSKDEKDNKKMENMEKQIQTLQLSIKMKMNENGDQCILCCDDIANIFNYPCGHICYCSQCSIDAIKNNNKCPQCRQQIKECKNIYYAGFKQNNCNVNVNDDDKNEFAINTWQ